MAQRILLRSEKKDLAPIVISPTAKPSALTLERLAFTKNAFGFDIRVGQNLEEEIVQARRHLDQHLMLPGDLQPRPLFFFFPVSGKSPKCGPRAKPTNHPNTLAPISPDG